jgi:hypothetical protein
MQKHRTDGHITQQVVVHTSEHTCQSSALTKVPYGTKNKQKTLVTLMTVSVVYWLEFLAAGL